MSTTTQTEEFVPRVQDDDPHFAGSLYVKEDRVYNVELPNGDAVCLCFTSDKDGPCVQVISSTWCEKTALDVQAKDENKRFKPNGKTFAHQPSTCKKTDCNLCAYMAG
jgi:hypothetical protein